MWTETEEGTGWISTFICGVALTEDSANHSKPHTKARTASSQWHEAERLEPQERLGWISGKSFLPRG